MWTVKILASFFMIHKSLSLKTGKTIENKKTKKQCPKIIVEFISTSPHHFPLKMGIQSKEAFAI
jgi:hypothetical protein